MSWLERIGAFRPPPLYSADGHPAFSPRRYDLAPPGPAPAPPPAAAEAPLPPAAVIAARVAIQAYLGGAAPSPSSPEPRTSPHPPASPQPSREALIADAMRHWRKGHAIFLRLDPGLRARVRGVAEHLAPK